MNESRFYEPYIQPWSTTILRVRLKPLSLGHLILLHGIESSFVVGGEHSFDDLASSIFICSKTFDEAVAGFHDPKLPKIMTKWAKKLGVFDFAEKCALFAEYIREGTEAPHHQIPESDGPITPIQCPSVQLVKVTLMTKCGFHERDLLDRPWRLCLLDFLTLKAMEGRAQFLDEETLSDIEAARRYANEFEAKLREEGRLG